MKWTLKQPSPAVMGFTGYLLIWSCAGGGNKEDHRKGSTLHYEQSVQKGKKSLLFAIHQIRNTISTVLLHFPENCKHEGLAGASQTALPSLSKAIVL